MNSFQEVDRAELELVEGGGAILIVLGAAAAGAVAGLAAGYLIGNKEGKEACPFTSK